MGKLTDINIVARNEYGDTLGIVTPVSVTKEGLFTTTLPEDAVNKLLDYGVSMSKNRQGREGYFSAKTLDDLRKDIRNFMEEALSRELIQEETVIKYQIKTAGSCYIDSDGEILPNGGWTKDRLKEGHWAKFTEYSDAMHMQQAKIQVWVGVYDRKRYRFKSGKEIEDLKRRRCEINRTQEEKTNLNWLCDQVCMVADGTYRGDVSRLQEVPATEENAAIFVKIMKFIYMANQLFTELSYQENLLAFIEANRPLALPDFVDNQEGV